ncbi:iron-siderophore ABC transporter substrate-binding protein [Lusitaniella coriacea LEGE 07157]|uniref:Iron-siderophore ABC transporter substrate-binding protein n=1 Tax=Lusitaniella coriacea LEGE 07157 TaxID=945747 RepID=A0A8J7E2Q5_9CYAN|nr:iron-siderophore ABC transporter substrate-binding protein [Lusitaniella coriacea]MBE9117719.1 iron-siderophore ABC transporter substrate-binding protein [Lusitaniella coriacea LEGE 07157]
MKALHSSRHHPLTASLRHRVSVSISPYQSWIHKLKFTLLALLTACLVVACGNPTPPANVNAARSPAGECQVIQHELGETTVCGTPKKIVALGLNPLDVLLSLEVQPAGFADVIQLHRGEFDNPSQQIPYLGEYVTSKPANIGSSRQPSFEALAQLQPDLILAMYGPANNDQYEKLSQIAPTLFVPSLSLRDWQESIQMVAKAIDREQKAKAVIETYEQQLADARSDLAPAVVEHPKILLLAATKLDKIALFDEAEYSGGLLKELGFEVLTIPELKGEERTRRTNVSLEAIAQLNPDTIIVQGYNLDLKKLIAHKIGLNLGKKGGKLGLHQVSHIQTAWQESALAQSMEASKRDRV